MGKLDGKIALVTGGNSGIGLATAKHFVQEGAYVFITGRRERELAAAVKEIGRNVTGVQGDVSKLADLDRLFAQVKREKGRLDSCSPMPALRSTRPSATITEEHYDAIFDVNVKGVLFTVQKALPLMPDGASVILNASIVATKGLPVEQRLQRHEGRVALVRAHMDGGFEGPPHSRERRESGLIDTPGLNELLAASGAGEQRRRAFPALCRSAASAPRTKSPRRWCFSPPTTAVTSRERNCLWMAVSHKCRRFATTNCGGDAPMTSDLPEPLREYFAAANARDPDGAADLLCRGRPGSRRRT